MSVANSSLSLLFSLSFTSLSPTFSFSLSFSIFQICEHENKSKLNTLDNTDIETIFAFLFFFFFFLNSWWILPCLNKDWLDLTWLVFIDSLIVSASQDAGGHAIFRHKNPRVTFGLSYLLIESFYIGMSVVRTDVRLRDYKSQPKFLGYIRQANLLTHGAPLRALRARKSSGNMETPLLQRANQSNWI